MLLFASHAVLFVVLVVQIYTLSLEGRSKINSQQIYSTYYYFLFSFLYVAAFMVDFLYLRNEDDVEPINKGKYCLSTNILHLKNHHNAAPLSSLVLLLQEL